jgi:hypothetical protein
MTPAVTPNDGEAPAAPLADAPEPSLESLDQRVARLERRVGSLVRAHQGAMDLMLQLTRTLGPIAGAVDKLREIGRDES